MKSRGTCGGSVETEMSFCATALVCQQCKEKGERPDQCWHVTPTPLLPWMPKEAPPAPEPPRPESLINHADTNVRRFGSKKKATAAIVAAIMAENPGIPIEIHSATVRGKEAFEKDVAEQLEILKPTAPAPPAPDPPRPDLSIDRADTKADSIQTEKFISDDDDFATILPELTPAMVKACEARWSEHQMRLRRDGTKFDQQWVTKADICVAALAIQQIGQMHGICTIFEPSIGKPKGYDTVEKWSYYKSYDTVRMNVTNVRAAAEVVSGQVCYYIHLDIEGFTEKPKQLFITPWFGQERKHKDRRKFKPYVIFATKFTNDDPPAAAPPAPIAPVVPLPAAIATTAISSDVPAKKEENDDFSDWEKLDYSKNQQVEMESALDTGNISPISSSPIVDAFHRTSRFWVTPGIVTNSSTTLSVNSLRKSRTIGPSFRKDKSQLAIPNDCNDKKSN